MLKVKDVSYAYDNQLILSKINLHIQDGETVAILGPSGVGKTTLFNLIAGVEPVQEGYISIDDSQQLQGKVSYMLQKDMLYRHYTVIENIMLPLIINGERKKEARNKAIKLLQQFNLAEWGNYYPHALSGGMRQRVALMRTAAFGREWVLLDEAFSALDAITRQQLQEWFVEYRQRMGWSTLFITHDIDEALLLGDRIYIIKGKPGTITAEIQGIQHKEKLRELIFSPEFLTAKKAILNALD